MISAGVSVVNSMVSGEEGSSLTVQCLYTQRFRYLVFLWRILSTFYPLKPLELSLKKHWSHFSKCGNLSINFHWYQTLVDSEHSLTLLWLPVNRLSEKKWCRSGDPSSCLSTGSERSYEDTSVTISDDRTEAFTVTLKKLQMRDADWYLCSAGQQQVAVQVQVRPHGSTSKLIKSLLYFRHKKHNKLYVWALLSNWLETVIIKLHYGFSVCWYHQGRFFFHHRESRVSQHPYVE